MYSNRLARRQGNHGQLAVLRRWRSVKRDMRFPLQGQKSPRKHGPRSIFDSRKKEGFLIEKAFLNVGLAVN
jgi:hypothetical protein